MLAKIVIGLLLIIATGMIIIKYYLNEFEKLKTECNNIQSLFLSTSKSMWDSLEQTLSMLGVANPEAKEIIKDLYHESMQWTTLKEYVDKDLKTLDTFQDLLEKTAKNNKDFKESDSYKNFYRTMVQNSRNLNDIIDEFNKYAVEYNKKISDTHTKKIAMTFEYNHKQIIDGKYTNFK